MAEKPPEGALLLLDACCLINLFATGRVEAILASLPYRFAVSRLVSEKEVLTIAGSGPEGRERVSPEGLERSGLLAVMDLEGERLKSEFVRFAAELDDGEASICALAVVHGGGVATDDRKALRLLARPGVRVPTVQTPELLYDWARLARASEADVRAVLKAVRDRARFFPRPGAPRFEWWASFFQPGAEAPG